jgi:hypothetical protein
MSSPLSLLANDRITLIKPDGTRRAANAIVDSTKNRISVFEPTFPVEAGDTIEHALPHGKPQLYEVVDPGWDAAHHDDLSLWYIKVKIRW